MNRRSNSSSARARSSAVDRDHGSRTWTAWQSVASSISGPERLPQRPELGALVRDPRGGAAGVPGAVRRRARRRGVAARPALEAGPDLEPAEPERAVQLRLGRRPSRAATRRSHPTRTAAAGRGPARPGARGPAGRPPCRRCPRAPSRGPTARTARADPPPPQRALVQLAEAASGWRGSSPRPTSRPA